MVIHGWGCCPDLVNWRVPLAAWGRHSWMAMDEIVQGADVFGCRCRCRYRAQQTLSKDQLCRWKMKASFMKHLWQFCVQFELLAMAAVNPVPLVQGSAAGTSVSAA